MALAPRETTRAYLEVAPLPNHSESYTVVSHKEIIQQTVSMLNAAGFYITTELYKTNAEAQVAQGIYHIVPRNSKDEDIQLETEMGMMFAWTNSYDKSVRFQCAIGAYVMVCNNGMIAGDMMNFARKHTGSANYDIKMQISNQIKNAEKYYKKIIQDRNTLKLIILSEIKQAELIGRLYIEKEIITLSQLSIIKSELKKPSYVYDTEENSAWVLYNHVTHALKKAHPRNWFSKTQAFHEFMMADLVGKMGINTKDTVKEIATVEDVEMEVVL